jgi:TonB family protein
MHALLIAGVLVVQAASARTPSLGGDAVLVEMVTLGEPVDVPYPPEDANNPPEEQVPEEQVEQVPGEQVPEEQVEQVPGEQVPEEQVEQVPEEQVPEEQVEQPETQGYSAVTSQGEPGAGAPGPATYEGRVFAAIRRNFRTSVQPDRSYRIEMTVNPDGTVDVLTVRTSGVDAFDRAVQTALSMAQMPPFPPGRTSPAVIRIEFLGPEAQ